MKRTMALATFLVAGAGVLGAGAIPLHLRGSDSLFNVINDLLAQPNCGGGVNELHYVGGGSGNGSVQMRNQQQEVAPMSSPLSVGPSVEACNHPAHGADSEHIAWALDGLSVAARKSDVTSCGAADGFGRLRSSGTVTVYDMNEDGDGTAGNGTIDCPAGVTCSPSYAINATNGWRDVLDVLYFGVHNLDRGATSGLDGKKMCNSDLRYTLAGVVAGNQDPAANPPPPAGYNAWSQSFGGGCTTGICNRIEHLWRRGDDSGTTDTFVSLVCGSFNDNDCQFCNGVINTNNRDDDGVDFDPIRRTCNAVANPAAANKRTCSTFIDQRLTGCPDIGGQTKLSCGSPTATQAEKNRRWSLGLVQPVVVPENLNQYITYPTSACEAPKIRRAPQFPPGFPSVPSRCPCGEPKVGGACTVTADDGDEAGCFYSGFVVPVGSGACNAKVFNNEIRNLDGSLALDPANKQYLSAAYRMRTGFASGNCTDADSTSQIGCLTANLACTMGYAGREACDPTNPNNDCMEVNGVEPTDENVRLGTYRLSRTLYLSSILGFEKVDTAVIGTDALPNTFDPDGPDPLGPLVASDTRTQAQLDAQIQLAGCVSNETLTEPSLVSHGFVTLYDPANYVKRGGTDARCAYCLDYDNSACGLTNVDACPNNASIGVDVPFPESFPVLRGRIPFAASNVRTGVGVDCD